jgi:cytochrome c-type biogenesis protein CcmH/NrfG
MSNSSVQASTTASLSILSSEADSLLEQAKAYRVLMDQLPANDPKRQVYEQIIVDLLQRSQRISVAVTTSANSG